MSNISQTLRDNKLDADTKLLIDEGIINRDGTLTEEGARVTRDYAFDHFKAQILADIRTEKGIEQPKAEPGTAE